MGDWIQVRQICPMCQKKVVVINSISNLVEEFFDNVIEDYGMIKNCFQHFTMAMIALLVAISALEHLFPIKFKSDILSGYDAFNTIKGFFYTILTACTIHILYRSRKLFKMIERIELSEDTQRIDYTPQELRK